MTTPIYGLVEGADNQSQPFTTAINPNWRILEAIASKVAAGFENAAPGTPEEGDRVIVGDAPTGAFEGHDDELAVFAGGGWHFVPLQPGELWHVDGTFYRRDTSSGWVDQNISDAT